MNTTDEHKSNKQAIKYEPAAFREMEERYIVENEDA